MIDVGAELLAAQKLLQLQPAITCTVSEMRLVAFTPDWQAVPPPAGDTSQYMDAAVAGDGSLIRVRLSGGQIQTMRVASPKTAASWAGASWGNVIASAAATPPAIFADPQAGQNVYIVYVTTAASRVVRLLTSTDYGATFGGSAIVYTHASGAVEYLGGGIRTTGVRDIFVFWCFNGATRVLYSSSQPAAGGAWSAPAAWSLGALGACTGFDVEWYDGDFLVLLAGSPSGATTARLWAALFGDGNKGVAGTWVWQVVESSDVTGFSYVGPRLCVAGDVVRCAYLDAWTGTGAFRRQMLIRPLHGDEWKDGLFLDPEPFNYAPASAFSAVLCCFPASLDLFLVGHDAAYYATLRTAAVSLSDRLAGYDWREDHDTCRLTVVLDNYDGRYNNAGADASTYRALRLGSQISLRRGLYVGGVAYTQPVEQFIIERLEHEMDGKGRMYLVVHCVGWWSMLEQWSAGRLFQWTGSTTLATICATIAARVGMSFQTIGGEGSTLMTTWSPTFSVAPGTNGKAALLSAAYKGGDVLRFDGLRVLYKQLVRTEVADYAMGGAGEHPVLLGSFVEGAMADNMVEVYGAAGELARSYDWNDLALVGTRRRKVVDGLYATAGKADKRSDGEIERVHDLHATGWVECFPVFGVELWDVLGITSDRHGFTSRRYRVAGIRERWDWTRGFFKQRLGLVALE